MLTLVVPFSAKDLSLSGQHAAFSEDVSATPALIRLTDNVRMNKECFFLNNLPINIKFLLHLNIRNVRSFVNTFAIGFCPVTISLRKMRNSIPLNMRKNNNFTSPLKKRISGLNFITDQYICNSG